MRESAIGEERNWALAAYGLLLIAPGSGGITALVGVILAYLRRDTARGSLYESHYRNLILVFWVWLVVTLLMAAFAFTGIAALLLSLVTWPTWSNLLFPYAGIFGLWSLCWILTGIWYYWRLLRGLVRILDDKPY
jgi:uncharacterized membrane protein